MKPLLLHALLLMTFASKPAAPPPDAATVFERVAKECPAGSKSEACKTLRLQVEGVMLDSIVGLRAAGMKVDPKVYRVAARAETPELAAFGMRGILLDGAKTPEERALLAAALDSPYAGVRSIVIMQGQQLDGLKEMIARVPSDGVRYGADAGLPILAGIKEPAPDAKAIGGYPGARFRPFASSASRVWFTTADPPDRVAAWFTKSGKKVLTGAQVKAAAAATAGTDPAELQRQMLEAVADQDSDKMQELMEAAAHPKLPEPDWSRPFDGMEGTGDMRFVLVSGDRAVAIFRDDLLKATSIVATPPMDHPSADPEEIERMTRKAKIKAIYGN